MNCLKLSFQQAQTSDAVCLQSTSELPAAISLLGFTAAQPTLVLIGGASGLSADDADKLRALFREVLCPIAQTFGLVMVDGGTDSGVMRLIGQARQETGSTFPLIGVVVQDKAILPAGTQLDPIESDATPLEPNHTHFLLVPGSEWGDESGYIAQTATLLARGAASATILINGGAIALHQDVPNSLEQQRPVLVLGGTGRTADRLASVAMGQTQDAEIQPLVNSGFIQAIDWLQDPDASQLIQQIMRDRFGNPGMTDDR